jgi:hypothetical protein
MSQGVKYAVDLVICIDGTGSMGPIIEQVKSSALKFYDNLEAVMAKKEKTIDQLRAKIIVFRDYWADSEPLAMQSSTFFNLRTQSADFAKFVSEITATGGGDEPENGLEGLALALKSDWEKSQDFARQRHVVIVYTDASAHSLEKPSKPSHYPQDIPKTFDELTDCWHDMPVSPKRLLLFAPDASPWSIMSTWDNAIHFSSKAGDGLQEFEMDEILNVIANSI